VGLPDVETMDIPVGFGASARADFKPAPYLIFSLIGLSNERENRQTD
jgi:hypothetical protein